MPTRRDFLAVAGTASAAGLAGAACRPADLWSPPSLLGPPTSFAVPTGKSLDLVAHVLNRCTFGARPGDRESLLALGPTPAEAVDTWLDGQLEPASIDDRPLEHALRAFASTFEPLGDLYEYKKPALLHDLTRATLLRAVFSKRQLLEVMVELWTDHFNIDISKGECAWLKAADDRDVIRRHAFGRFRDLLRASALSPAMLTYLDGRENRSASPAERPNENYARELLELHTLGVHGGYTQRDVMEVARCLTGWTVRSKHGFFKGRVEFHAECHDHGEKAVLGRRIPAGGGPRDLDLVLETVSAHPATARHLATKLCRRFLSEDAPASATSAVATAFLRSEGDIKTTLRALFAHPEFSAEKPALRSRRGARLKRPFHFLASALRAADASTDAGEPLLAALSAMGHAPFQYPTPDGYPSDPESWRGSLVFRLKLAGDLATNRLAGTRVDLARLRERAGGGPGLAAHVLGRRPGAREAAALRSLPAAIPDLALLLAAPAFQRY